MIANDTRDQAKRAVALNVNTYRVTRERRLSEGRRAVYSRPRLEPSPKVDSENAFVRKLSNFISLSPGELACLAEIQLKPEKVAARTDLIDEGQTGDHAYILQSGWAYCYKLVPDGGRQVIIFSVPGDFIGGRSILLRTSDHSVATVTDAEVNRIPMPRIIRLFNEHRRLGSALLWAISRDDSIAVEHLVDLGRRSAIERMAHLFLELRQRLQLVGMATDTKFECPLNQYLLADALGLTAVHVNRVLRQLREQGLITLKAHHVIIDDLKGLMKLAGFDDAYLDQPRPWAKIDDQPGLSAAIREHLW